MHVILRQKELHLSLLVFWVRFAVDEPAPAPLHPVTVPAALLDDAFGLEAQGELQAGQGRGPGPRGPRQERGEHAGLRRARAPPEQRAQGGRQHPRHEHAGHVVAGSARDRETTHVASAREEGLRGPALPPPPGLFPGSPAATRRPPVVPEPFPGSPAPSAAAGGEQHPFAAWRARTCGRD